MFKYFTSLILIIMIIMMTKLVYSKPKTLDPNDPSYLPPYQCGNLQNLKVIYFLFLCELKIFLFYTI